MRRYTIDLLMTRPLSTRNPEFIIHTYCICLQHRRRVENIQPYVDCSRPRTMIVSKKKEIERKRYLATIERGNRLLLDRLGK
jgi:hypothetical protein